MLIFMFLFIFSSTGYVLCRNVGSTLFYNRNAQECWNEGDLNKLRARRLFENITLPQITPDNVNKRYIKQTLQYYGRAFRTVEKNGDPKDASILKEALADTIGGQLRSKVLPTVRFAYYAGYVPFYHVRQLHDVLDEIKKKLNTQGVGWKEPAKFPEWSNLTVAKILIGAGRFLDPCTSLVTKRDTDKCIHLPPLKQVPDDDPAAISLPFKKGGLFSLTSPSSDSIILKYYTTAARCILGRSPDNCRHSDFVSFNNEVWHWMKKNVAPHLMDEKLYAAYGGVLRVAAAVQNYGKGLSRRNLFDYEYLGEKKWNPWSAISQSYLFINADWTPQLYVCLVVAVAIAICLLQMCYNYIFGHPDGCNCNILGRRKKCSFSEDVVYANVDTKFPAVLPSHGSKSIASHSDKQDKVSLPKVKSSYTGSITTQRVYDLNDNMEKFMSVIMSDEEGSEMESSASSLSKRDSGEDCQCRTVLDVGSASVQTKRPTSPPEIEASISHLNIEPSRGDHLPMYSTSTVTRSDTTYRAQGRASETPWTGSTSSDGSISTVSSKTRSRRSKLSRDMAWARRVVSKHSSAKSATATDDVTSCTTQPAPSRR